jgi:Flp pilus assembly protein CpaB
VVAAKEIPAGTAFNDDMIKKGMVKAVQWPKASVPAGSFSSPEQVVGKTNRVKIMANEPISSRVWLEKGGFNYSAGGR